MMKSGRILRQYQSLMSPSLLFSLQLRQKSHFVVLDYVDQQLSQEKIKHRQHPGIIKPRNHIPPVWLQQHVKEILKEEKLSTMETAKLALEFRKKLCQRHVPLEESELQQRLKKLIAQTSTAMTTDLNTIVNRYRQTISGYWYPIEYNKSNSLLYLIGRSIQDYVVLCKVFNEIKNRDANFKPYTVLDFGSGVGTVLWAASEMWQNTLQCYVGVDSSSSMHELANRLACNTNLKMESIYQREYLPVSSSPTYDVVTSAYSLLELPNTMTRLRLLSNLWEKTEQYLVLIEHGTKAGFRVVNEARDYILSLTKQEKGQSEEASVTSGYVFSPCPHDQPCPRYTKNVVCNFETIYPPFSFTVPNEHQSELFSYVVLKKGSRPTDDEQWPRIVRPILKRSSHVICRMCTGCGAQQEEIFTRFKNGRNTYRCARSSNWGDRLPIRFVDENIEFSSVQND